MATKLKNFNEIDWNKKRIQDDRLSKLGLFVGASLFGGIFITGILMLSAYQTIPFIQKIGVMIAIVALSGLGLLNTTLKLFHRTGRYFDNEPVSLTKVDCIPLQVQALIGLGAVYGITLAADTFLNRIWINLTPMMRFYQGALVFISYGLVIAALTAMVLFCALSIYRQAKNKYGMIAHSCAHTRSDDLLS